MIPHTDLFTAQRNLSPNPHIFSPGGKGIVSMRAAGCLLTVLLSLTVAATTSPIKYVIVLMLENRSFDHMLGFLKQLNQQVDSVKLYNGI
jgi:hypothetical protein